MPMTAIQRAEKVLLNICSDLRTLQVNSLSFQTKIVDDIQDVYKNKIALSKKAGLPSLFGLAAQGAPLFEKAGIKTEVISSLNSVITAATPSLTAFYLDPKKLSYDMQEQRIGAQSQENSAWSQGLGSILQTYERAMDQLHNVENNIRSGS